jgi:hypothetical protein
MRYLLYLLQLCRKLCISRVQQAHAILKQCYLRRHLRAASPGALERSFFQPQVRLKRLIKKKKCQASLRGRAASSA